MKTKEQYDYNALYKMLGSQDEESYVLGLQCIEHMDTKANLASILLLYKAFPDKGMWGVHAPITFDKIKKFLNINSSENFIITYRDIMRIMRDQMVEKDQVEIFLKEVTSMVKHTLVTYGFDFIEDVTLVLKNNNDE
jgi:hypothetical protein